MKIGYFIGVVVVVVLLAHALTWIEHVRGDVIREFHHFGRVYSVDASKTVMYQVAVPNLHGTMTLNFDRHGQWSGNYSLTHSYINARFFFDTFESEMFSFGFTNLSCENKKSCQITITTQRSVLKNVDPYGMVIVGVKRDPVKNQLIQVEVPFLNFGEYDLTSMFTISDSQIREKLFSFQYYMQGVVHPHSNMRTAIPISFPRDVNFQVDEYKTRMSILVSFDNATIIEKSQIPDSPKIHMQNTFSGQIPALYTSIFGFELSKLNLKPNQKLYQRISIPFTYDTSTGFKKTVSFVNKGFFIEMESIRCAYADPVSKMVIVDDNSHLMEIRAFGTMKDMVLQCSDYDFDDTYQIFIIGMQDDRKRKECMFGQDCDMSGKTTQYYNIMTDKTRLDNLVVKGDKQSEFGGSLIVKNENVTQYLQYAAPKTFQTPLTLKVVFLLNITNLILSNSKTSDNLLHLEYTNIIQPHVDPFSMRVSILDEATNSFILNQVDEPKLGEAIWSVPMVNDKKMFTFGLWVYDSTTAKLGDVVFVNYPRRIQYSLENSVNLIVYFENIEIRDVLHRPYYIVNEVKELSTYLSHEYTLIKSFNFNYRDGLDIMNYDEGRIFQFPLTTQFLDSNGEEIPLRFEEMTCAYLLKDPPTGKFTILDYSDDRTILKQDENQNWIYELDCSEDIRETEFYVMLIAKKFKREVQTSRFGEVVVFDPRVTNEFRSEWSTKDVIQISVNPNSDLEGYYILDSKEVRDYQGFEKPETKQQPLTILGVFELTQNSRTNNDEKMLNAIDVYVRRESSIFNMDPHSFRLFKVNKEKSTFELLFEDKPFEGPWNLQDDLLVNREFTFAICAYTFTEAEFGDQYPVSYSRELKFDFHTNGDYVSYTFENEKNLKGPTFSIHPVESMPIIDPITKDVYEGIYTFRITQNILNFGLQNWRKFAISNLDEELDVSTITCAYVFGQDNLLISHESKPNVTESRISMTCSESVLVNSYNFMIIAKKKEVPPPNPPTPEPSIKPNPEPSVHPIPEPSIKPNPPTPIPSDKPNPPTPEPSIKPNPEPSIRPVPVPSIRPEPSLKPNPPTPVPSIKPKPPVPEPTVKPNPPIPVPSIRPIPTPISSFDRENGINLIKDAAVSRNIQSGDSILYRISIRPNQRLSLSCFSLTVTSMNILIGQDFKPSQQQFTLKMNTNQVRSIENRSPNSQVVFVMVEGPSAGSSQFTLLPSIEKIDIPSNSQNKDNNSYSMLFAVIAILTLLLIGSMFVTFGIFVYLKRKKTIIVDETYELIAKRDPNRDQVRASYYTEENL